MSKVISKIMVITSCALLPFAGCGGGSSSGGGASTSEETSGGVFESTWNLYANGEHIARAYENEDFSIVGVIDQEEGKVEGRSSDYQLVKVVHREEGEIVIEMDSLGRPSKVFHLDEGDNAIWLSYDGDDILVSPYANGLSYAPKRISRQEVDNYSPSSLGLVTSKGTLYINDDMDSSLGGLMTAVKLGLCPLSLISGFVNGGIGFAWSAVTCPAAAYHLVDVLRGGDIRFSEGIVGTVVLSSVCSESVYNSEDRVTSCFDEIRGSVAPEVKPTPEPEPTATPEVLLKWHREAWVDEWTARNACEETELAERPNSSREAWESGGCREGANKTCRLYSTDYSAGVHMMLTVRHYYGTADWYLPYDCDQWNY